MANQNNDRVVRQLRDRFTKKYSRTTREIIKRFAKNPNVTSQELADSLNVSVGTVATTKANLTRGWYAPFAEVKKGKVVGTCQY